MESKLKLFDELLKNKGINVMELNLSCVNFELMAPIAEEANITEKDISGLLAYSQKLVQNGGSNTRKKKHTLRKKNKKNKTQRGGLTSPETIGYILLSALALVIVAAITTQPGQNDRSWGPGGYSSQGHFARRRRENNN
jgi:hypothetical protein